MPHLRAQAGIRIGRYPAWGKRKGACQAQVGNWATKRQRPGLAEIYWIPYFLWLFSSFKYVCFTRQNMAWIRGSPFSECKRLHHAFPVSVQPASSSLKSFRKRVIGHIRFPAHSVRSRKPRRGRRRERQRSKSLSSERRTVWHTPTNTQGFLLIKKSLECISVLGPTLHFTERFTWVIK